MNPYSHIDASMAGYQEQASLDRHLRRVEAWPEKDRSDKAVERRRSIAERDFWAFDRIYFPDSMYVQGKSAVGEFHRRIVLLDDLPGVQLILGPRGHGKTVTLKKKLLWRIATGRIRLAGVYCETIPKASAMLSDLVMLISDNDRLMYDYRCEIVESNADQVTISIAGQYHTVSAFSEGRSVRGFSRGFARPEYMLADDIETLTSAFAPDAVRLRLSKLREAHASLCDGATLTILGNNFDEHSATNTILKEQTAGILPDNWQVHVFKGWDRGKPLWKARFPAADEASFRRMVGALDEHDYQGNYQMNPIPPEGFIFRREHLQYFAALPADAKGVLYLDPNLALKGKGDTTAIVRLLWSQRTGKLYVSARCLSFSDPNSLLDTALAMRTPEVRGIALDGHVSQESHWTHHIRAWCRKHSEPFPHVEFKRYHTDDLATNFAQVYAKGEVLFDPVLNGSAEGAEFFKQFFSFRGKKAKRKDDAPDAAICAYQFLSERKLIRRVSAGTTRPSIIIPDIY